MGFQIFCYKVPGDQRTLDEMNRFLLQHAVVHVTHQGRDRDGVPYEVFVVEYEDSGVSTMKAVQKQVLPQESSAPRKDYRVILGETRFAVYLSLFRLRKQLAEQESVPAFKILTNDQLAQLVQLEVMTLEKMQSISGIGKARIEKYGPVLLELLKAEIPLMREKLQVESNGAVAEQDGGERETDCAVSEENERSERE